jgi:hypothetical protein
MVMALLSTIIRIILFRIRLSSSSRLATLLRLRLLRISGHITLPTRCRLRLLIPVLGTSLKQSLFKQVPPHMHKLLSLNNVAV